MAVKVFVLLTGLLSIWLCASCSYAQENSTEIPVFSSNVTTEPPEPPEFGITLEAEERQTSSIKIKWRVPRIYEVKYYRVRSNRADSEATTLSADLTETEYTIEDLRKDSTYNICVIAYRPEQDTNVTVVEECLPFDTIAMIRDDSLIALFCVIGVLLLCIIAGYICWKCKQKKMNEDEDEEEGENAKLNNANGNPVSIEDNDIPFITPPPDELTPEERKEYDAAAKV